MKFFLTPANLALESKNGLELLTVAFFASYLLRFQSNELPAQENEQTINSVDTSNLTSGVYFYAIKSRGASVHTGKLVVTQ